MAQGQRLTDRQIEIARLAYAETGSKRQAAYKAKCSPSAVKRYLDPVEDDLVALRTQKKADIIEEIVEVRLVLLAAMKSKEKVDKASMAELATSFGILTDKHQIMTGKATSRTETGSFDSDRLSPDQQEKMAELIDIGTKRAAS